VRVLFHTNTLNYRGTTVAITDYAKYNQEVLGNESVIAYNASHGYDRDMGSEQAVVDELKKQFNVVGYKEGDLEGIISKEQVDLAYFIRAGKKEDLPRNCRTAVHAVFQFNESHGDRYAYISKWLSEKMSNGSIPYVPHIVSLPAPTGNYRKALGISDDKIVIGRIGGYFTFDLQPVKDYISKFVTTTDKYIFLFVGTEPFIDHPNVKFINEIHSPQKKANFINTCDAMLHARVRGESFGLSIAEFLHLNKPVLAWAGGHDLNHVEMLRECNTLYTNVEELSYLLSIVPELKQKEGWSEITQSFTPNIVMNKFKQVFYD
jgi:glycosyltransferase involved in cell wall biosynthesis